VLNKLQVCRKISRLTQSSADREALSDRFVKQLTDL
jgi:hypothetical protein